MKKVVNSSKKLTISELVNFGFAGLFTIMAVAQLFKFDEFIDLISKNSGVGGGAAYILAAMIVVFEVFAIPYLVELQMNKIIYAASLLCVLMTGMFWIIVAFSTGLVESASDIGAFGTIIAIKPGIEAIIFSLLIASLSIFSCRKYLFK